MLLLLDANGGLVLMALGLLLICAEFCLPGWVIPGVVGGVCLLCGVYRLTLLDTSFAAASALALAVGVSSASGYGRLPAWIGWGALACIPWICRALVPGAIHWVTAAFAALAPAIAFGLLRIAARAADNKTLLQ